MPVLVPPTTDAHQSFLEAMDEFIGEGRGREHDDSMVGSEIRTYRDRWHTPDGFAHYVAELRADADEQTPRPPGIVPCTTLWWIDKRDYLGRLAIRHRLTPQLRQVGGHIGYDIRPSARRHGHGTAMLAAALPIARSLGISTALITCDVTNLASRAMIERHGGMLADELDGKCRYWLESDRDARSPRPSANL
jgi:predicted acetyltransferase